MRPYCDSSQTRYCTRPHPCCPPTPCHRWGPSPPPSPTPGLPQVTRVSALPVSSVLKLSSSKLFVSKPIPPETLNSTQASHLSHV